LKKKQNANHSCSSFNSQSLTESSNALVSLRSEKDDVATQTLGSSGSKLHYQDRSKSMWPSYWSLAPSPKMNILRKKVAFYQR
jgi:hypothetical protein